jgi:hypothetical protein
VDLACLPAVYVDGAEAIFVPNARMRSSRKADHHGEKE